MIRTITFIFTTWFCCLSCKKDNERLNEKPDSSIIKIITLNDAQAALDLIPVMNFTPMMGELSGDNFHLPLDTNGITQVPVEMNAYFWRSDIYMGHDKISDWNIPYKQVLQANTILEALKMIGDSSDVIKRNNIKGAALFFRAHAHLNIALLFAALPFASTPDTKGIPLRLSTDASIRSTRATIGDTYSQILNDLLQAVNLQSASIDSKRKNRPSRAATYGLMSRTCLFMGNYPKAQEYADSCLHYYSTLTDFKSLTLTTADNPFISNTNEIIFGSTLLSSTILEGKSWYIDSTLFKSYDNNDLRKEIFFKTDSATQLPVQRYNYSGNNFFFSGIATDEILLIRAEAKAKNGDTRGAMDDLNKLLKNRWRADNLFISRTATSPDDAVQQIRAERRRELLWRGLRWIDIRRYNLESPGLPLKRITNNEVIKLEPNDLKFILPIPPDVIQLSGMPQNER